MFTIGWKFYDAFVSAPGVHYAYHVHDAKNCHGAPCVYGIDGAVCP
jgi:hypothetical protein